VILGSCGCDRADEPSGERPQQKLEDAPVAKESAWTWGYFFEAPDKAAVKSLFGERSRSELPPGKDTVVVVIPIRKSAAWWALPHDERNPYFHKKGDKIGHTAIGAKYVERIYRKLYHTRYAVETTDHDFITYFEFDRAHTDDFKSLLAQLRDPQQNPEWAFVDREYEIWMTKME